MNNKESSSNTKNPRSMSNAESTTHDMLKVGGRNSSISKIISEGKATEINNIVAESSGTSRKPSFGKVKASEGMSCIDIKEELNKLRFEKHDDDSYNQQKAGLVENKHSKSISQEKSTAVSLSSYNDQLSSNKRRRSISSTESGEKSEKDFNEDMNGKKTEIQKPQLSSAASGKKDDKQIKTLNNGNTQIELLEPEEVFKKKQKVLKDKVQNVNSVYEISKSDLSANKSYRILSPDVLFFHLEDVSPDLLNKIEDKSKYVACYSRLKTIDLRQIQPLINLSVLKEIELKENMKNVQLRHDIVFDPFLQFTPNLDGERGMKKKKLDSKYWNYMLVELIVIFKSKEHFNWENSLLYTMFETLRDIMASLLKESEITNTSSANSENEIATLFKIISPETITKGLYEKGTFDIIQLAEYLKFILQRLCAPMRDALINKVYENLLDCGKLMNTQDVFEDIKLHKGILNQFKFVFKILELMKLDVANHQIRLIRPALISNCISFERMFLQQAVYPDIRFNKAALVSWLHFPLNSNNEFDESIANNKSPIYWKNIFAADTKESPVKLEMGVVPFYKKVYIFNILRLISCCMLTKTMPVLLRFDVARICLLRSDLRECVCLLLIKFLYKQLVFDDPEIVEEDKAKLIAMYNETVHKKDISSIVSDEIGSYRWTRNVNDLALYLLNKVKTKKMELNIEVKDEFISHKKLEFTKNWLKKQIQPHSDVYQLLEFKIIKSIANHVQEKTDIQPDGNIKMDFFETFLSMQKKDAVAEDEPFVPQSDSLFELKEIEVLKKNFYQLIGLNWCVVGEKYAELLKEKVNILYEPKIKDS